MAKKKDPSITFLNKFGYNVIKLPRVGIEPMDVIGKDTTTQWLGPLSLVWKSPVAVPTPSAPHAAAVLAGQKTDALDLKFGLKVLANALAAFGATVPSLDFAYNRARKVQFSYTNVTSTVVAPFDAGNYLAGGTLNTSSPVVQHYFQDPEAEAFLILDVLKSDSITVTASDDHGVSVDVDVPSIQAMVGANVGVKVSGGSSSTLTYSGKQPVSFGFIIDAIEFDGKNWKLAGVQASGDTSFGVTAGGGTATAIAAEARPHSVGFGVPRTTDVNGASVQRRRDPHIQGEGRRQRRVGTRRRSVCRWLRGLARRIEVQFQYAGPDRPPRLRNGALDATQKRTSGSRPGSGGTDPGREYPAAPAARRRPQRASLDPLGAHVDQRTAASTGGSPPTGRSRSRVTSRWNSPLACDPLPCSEGASAGSRLEPKYDWAGMRQGAAQGLRQLYKQTTAFVNEKRPDLSETLQAWSRLQDNPSDMERILRRDDPGQSLIAAFALALDDAEKSRETLLDAYESLSNVEVKWGVANSMENFELGWVQEKVVKPWIVKAD